MTNERIGHVWPFNDPAFEGDAVSLLVDEFTDHHNHAGSPLDLQSFADLVASVAGNESLLEMDATQAAGVVGRSLRDGQPQEWLLAAAFQFGAAFALWRVEEAGLFETAGAQVWLKQKQADGGRSRAKPTWQDRAWRKAVELWNATPDRSATAVADDVHRWLHTSEAWTPMKIGAPTRPDTVRRHLVACGGADAARRQVLADGAGVPGA